MISYNSQCQKNIQHFGKYVAQKLNQFDATKKKILIHTINQLIFYAEMEKLSTETEVYHCEPGLLSSSISTPTSFELLNFTQFIEPKGTQSAYSHTTIGMESELEEFVHITKL